MKTKHFAKLLLLACLSLLFATCTTGENIIHISIGCDFTVTNITTGEQITDQGIKLGHYENLEVRNGDTLRLSYVPPTEYDDYSWTVTYSLFDETFSVKSPYTMDYTVKDIAAGEYSVTCTSHAEEEDLFDGYFNGTEYGHAVVKVVAD